MNITMITRATELCDDLCVYAIEERIVVSDEEFDMADPAKAVPDNMPGEFFVDG